MLEGTKNRSSTTLYFMLIVGKMHLQNTVDVDEDFTLTYACEIEIKIILLLSGTAK